MITFPNAKINIGLHVTGKRSDGFHALESLFYPIGLSDIMELIVLETGPSELSFRTSGRPIPGKPEDELCRRSYDRLNERYGCPPISAYLYKIIPTGSGLGGGSSDAAHFLKSAVEMTAAEGDMEELTAIAAAIGSDVPFFLSNRPAIVTGRGEEVTPMKVPRLAGKQLLVVHPGIEVSTRAVFEAVKQRSEPGAIRACIEHEAVGEWHRYIQNDLEAVAAKKYPTIGKIRDQLYEMGALFASMSGSGSAVFGIFDEAPAIDDALDGYFTWREQLQ